MGVGIRETVQSMKIAINSTNVRTFPGSGMPKPVSLYFTAFCVTKLSSTSSSKALLSMLKAYKLKQSKVLACVLCYASVRIQSRDRNHTSSYKKLSGSKRRLPCNNGSNPNKLLQSIGLRGQKDNVGIIKTEKVERRAQPT